MSNTYLQEKDATANVLGNTDGGTPDTVRDNAINSVRQNEIANAHPFSWTQKINSSITTVSGVADLPSDWNINHQPKDIRIVTGVRGGDHLYTQVPMELFNNYGSGDYVYFIDWNSSTNRWRINTKEDATLQATYYAIPPALTDDDDIDQIPDLDCIAFLAAARFFLASDGDETNHDRFTVLGQKRLDLMIQNDKRSRPQRLTRSAAFAHNMGWNSGY